MATVSTTLPSDGQQANVAKYNVPITDILTQVNGNLDGDNLADTITVTNLTVSGSLTAPDSDATKTGWITPDETWVYVSANTFKITGVDVTAKYPKGTRLKFTQTTVKYAVVISSAFSTDTTITIGVNTDYVIANAAITANYYSYAANPQDYPGAFNCAITFANLSGGALTYGRYAITGQYVDVSWKYTLGGAGVAGAVTASMPIPMMHSATSDSLTAQVKLVVAGGNSFIGHIRPVDANNVGVLVETSAAAYVGLAALSSTVPATWANLDTVSLSARYKMA